MFILKKKHDAIVEVFEKRLEHYSNSIKNLRMEHLKDIKRAEDLAVAGTSKNNIIGKYVHENKRLEINIEELQQKLSEAYQKVNELERDICINKVNKKQLRDLLEVKDKNGNRIITKKLCYIVDKKGNETTATIPRVMINQYTDLNKVYDLIKIL